MLEEQLPLDFPEDEEAELDPALVSAVAERICFTVIETLPDPSAEEGMRIDLARVPLCAGLPRWLLARVVDRLGGTYLTAVVGRPVAVSAGDSSVLVV